MTFRPVRNGQYEPVTATSSRDCVAAVTAMLMERATVGRIRVSHATVRAKSGAPSTRGLYLWEAEKAAAALGVNLEVVLNVSRNTFRDTVRGGNGVGVTIFTSVTRYTTRRTNFYVGPHEVYVNDYNDWPKGEICGCEKRTAAAHGEFTVEDPGTTSVGYLQWSADLLYRAAEKLTGDNGINLLVAPDTEIRPWKAMIEGQIRSEPDYDTGTKLAAIVVGKTYKGGRTENGGNWLRANGTKANGWTHVVISGTSPNYKWGWWAGRAGVQA